MRTAIVLIMLAFGLADAATLQTAHDRVQKTLPVGALRSVDISNVNGSTTITGVAAAAVVSVVADVAVKAATMEEAKRLNDEVLIYIKKKGSGLKLFVEYPKDWSDAPKVDFSIRVPSWFGVEASHVNGSLAISGVKSAHASVVTGNATVSGVADRLTLSAVSAEVRVKLGGEDGRVAVSTVSGDVLVEMPREAGADVRITSLANTPKITDLKTTSDEDGMFAREFVVGKGGRTVKIATVSGKVAIRGY